MDMWKIALPWNVHEFIFDTTRVHALYNHGMFFPETPPMFSETYKGYLMKGSI